MNCAVAGLTPYAPSSQTPWDRSRAVHLFRRIDFGANSDVINQSVTRDPLNLVNELIDDALARPLTPEPDFAYKTQSQYLLALLQSVLEKDGYAREWIIELQKSGLRGRMELFWHNHFVTRFDVYESSSYMYQYHKLLQTHALGNFKDFVREIGLTPAMLVFLNGTQNSKTSPNENYARELYELFTLGVDRGYTQNDIVETARALTGYTNITEAWGPIEFDPNEFDSGEKTIFGRTGNWDYDDVIDILFEEREVEISQFICEKLYRHFVNPDIDQEIINELAVIFRTNNWQIDSVLRALFTSAHFYDNANVSTQIYGHLEHILMFFNELGSDINGLTVLGIYADITANGQALFNPVDVAGWPGNRSWINTTSIGYRWDYLESQMGALLLFGFNQMGNFAKMATDETQDVEIICRDIINYVLPNGLQFNEDFEAALVSFKGEIPENYFVDGTWDINYWALPIQTQGLLNFLFRIPEYQLK